MGQVRIWRLVILVTLAGGVMGGIITDGHNDPSQGPLHRAKRYARIPLAYMNKVNPALLEEFANNNNNNFMYNTNAKRYILDTSPVSHFREFRLPTINNNNNAGRNQVQIPDPSVPRRMARRYKTTMAGVGSVSSSLSSASGVMGGPTSDFEVAANIPSASQLAPLSDEDLAKILLLLDGYALSTKGGSSSSSFNPGNNNDNDGPAISLPEQYYNPSYLSPEDLRRVARMYAMGKRENDNDAPGQGRFYDLERPESLDNQDPSIEANKLAFLTPKRSKRVGGPPAHKNLAKEANRYKKETDPKVIAQLEKVFSSSRLEEPRALPVQPSTTTISSSPANREKDSDSVTTTQSASTPAHSTNSGSGQIAGPTDKGSIISSKAKKSIDWSNYFGIDKKSADSGHNHHDSATVSNNEGAKLTSQQQQEAETATTPLVKSKAKTLVAARITQPTKAGVGMKESKEHKKLRVREENETENKSDRKWILNEFYKNMAMATNAKRKRDASKDEADELADLEQKMAAAGDDIIWDAVKYTGAHKDEPLSPIELAQVKKAIIEKLAAAYNLEKIREAIDEFREQLVGIKTNNV